MSCSEQAQFQNQFTVGASEISEGVPTFIYFDIKKMSLILVCHNLTKFCLNQWNSLHCTMHLLFTLRLHFMIKDYSWACRFHQWTKILAFWALSELRLGNHDPFKVICILVYSWTVTQFTCVYACMYQELLKNHNKFLVCLRTLGE